MTAAPITRPIYLSEIEELFESGAMPIDVALIEVSPPDSHGFCSFGVGVDTTLTAAQVASYVVAQVNDQMPRTYGDSFIHVSQIDAIVEVSRPLCALKRAESHRPADRDRAQCGRADRRRRGAADRHRRHSRCGAALADGPQRPGRSQRTGLRWRHSADRGGSASPGRARTSSRARSSSASLWAPRDCSSSSTTTRSSNSIPRPTPMIPA